MSLVYIVIRFIFTECNIDGYIFQTGSLTYTNKIIQHGLYLKPPPKKTEYFLYLMSYKLSLLLCLIFLSFQAEELLLSEKLDKEYSPIGGDGGYCTAVAKLAFGDDCAAINNNLV